MPSSGDPGAQRTIADVSSARTKEIIAPALLTAGSPAKTFDGPTGSNPHWIQFVTFG